VLQARHRHHPHPTTGVAADEVWHEGVTKSEGDPDGVARTGVEVGHSYGADAAGEGGGALELGHRFPFDPEVGAIHESGVARELVHTPI